MKKVKNIFENRRLISGNGRKQKGGFFSIAAAFIGKITGRGKKKSKTKTKAIKTLWPLKRVTLIRKLKKQKTKNDKRR